MHVGCKGDIVLLLFLFLFFHFQPASGRRSILSSWWEYVGYGRSLFEGQFRMPQVDYQNHSYIVTGVVITDCSLLLTISGWMHSRMF